MKKKKKRDVALMPGQESLLVKEVGGGIGMRNTCNSMADSCQCMTNPLQYCKAINLQLIKINEKIIIIINFITIIIPFYYRATLDHLLLPKILQEVLFLYLSLESILFLETSILFSTS